jgi:hypothetical protein
MSPWRILLKTSIKLIFHVFLEELLHAAMWLNCPRAEGQGAKKKFVLPIKSWFFTFFHFSFWLMVPHDITFNVTTTI